jgi:hypothetical protein
MTRATAARGRKSMGCSVLNETHARLIELAQGAGMPPARLAGELLDELVPTVTGVRRRLQIVRKTEQAPAR